MGLVSLWPLYHKPDTRIYSKSDVCIAGIFLFFLHSKITITRVSKVVINNIIMGGFLLLFGTNLSAEQKLSAQAHVLGGSAKLVCNSECPL